MASKVKYDTPAHPFESPTVARLRYTVMTRDGADAAGADALAQHAEAVAAKIAKRIADVLIEYPKVDLTGDQLDRLNLILRRGDDRA